MAPANSQGQRGIGSEDQCWGELLFTHEHAKVFYSCTPALGLMMTVECALLHGHLTAYSPCQ